MKYDCDVIRDLLPLYADDVCSPRSRGMVEEHLQECASCRDLLTKMKENEMDADLQNEKYSVLQYQEKRFKRRSATIGSIMSALFMIPILICLIINLSSNRPMGWFFVVLASFGVAAALILVPLMVPEDKAFWTFATFCASLMVLLAVICINTQGTWFWIASSAVLFGLAVVCLPFLIKTRPVKKAIGSSNPVLIVLILDVVLFVNMMHMIRSNGRMTDNSILYTLVVIAGVGFVVTEILRKGDKEEKTEEK